MKKLKRFLWTVYMILFCKPRSLKQFKIFCLKIDGMGEKEWEELEWTIRTDTVLSKYFKVK